MSDDSALSVLDVDSGKEVACLAGKLQPAVFASYADQIGRWYNWASLMVERNGHGHAVLLWLREYSRLTVLSGHDGNVGWLSSGKGKVLLYDGAAEAFRNRETILHSFAAFTQLCGIRGSTLRAPDRQHDDRADSYALALVALPVARRERAGWGEPFVCGHYPDPCGDRGSFRQGTQWTRRSGER